MVLFDFSICGDLLVIFLSLSFQHSGNIAINFWHSFSSWKIGCQFATVSLKEIWLIYWLIGLDLSLSFCLQFSEVFHVVINRDYLFIYFAAASYLVWFYIHSTLGKYSSLLFSNISPLQYSFSSSPGASITHMSNF